MANAGRCVRRVFVHEKIKGVIVHVVCTYAGMYSKKRNPNAPMSISTIHLTKCSNIYYHKISKGVKIE